MDTPQEYHYIIALQGGGYNRVNYYVGHEYDSVTNLPVNKMSVSAQDAKAFNVYHIARAMLLLLTGGQYGLTGRIYKCVPGAEDELVYMEVVQP